MNRRDLPKAFLGGGLRVLRRVSSGLKSGATNLLAAVVALGIDKEKRRFSFAFYISLVFLVLISYFMTSLLASSQTSIAKSSSADWDLGTNTGVTTTSDEIKLTGRSGSWYNSSAPTFYDSAYSYRRKISFDNSAQAENLTDFPVMLKLDNASLSWSGKIQADMDDVIFKEADGTALKWEWEKKDPTGESIAWVKIPQIDASSNTDYIYIDYGNPSATDQSDAVNVWTNGYAAVWHMNQASGNITDSTGNNTGVANGTLTYNDTSKIGGAIGFDGSSAYFDAGSHDSIDNVTPMTYQAWARPTNNPVGSDWRGIINKGGIDFSTYSSQLRYYTGWTSGAYYYSPSGTITQNQWSFLTTTYVYSTVDDDPIFYKDGSLISTTEITAPVAPKTSNAAFNALIGSNWSHTNYFYQGQLDEIRISNVIRSAPWIAAEYKNQGDNNFTSVGDEGTLDGFTYRRTITFDNSAQAENLTNFPVMVKATNDELNWASLVQADLDDVIFVDSDNSTLLDFEWEEKDSSGESISFVQVPQIDASSSSDYVYMYYGSATAADQTNPAGVWSNDYISRYSLADASGHLTDSTTNYTSTAETNLTYSVTGEIGNAIELNGTDSVANLSDIIELNSASAFTFSCWMNQDVIDVSDNIFQKYNGTSAILRLWTTSTGNLTPVVTAGAASRGEFDYSTVYTAGTWARVTVVYDGSQADNPGRLKLYINGDNQTMSYVGTIPAIGPNLATFDAFIGGGTNPFDGKIDEVQLSSSPRSADWIKASYLSESDQFTTFGAPQNSDNYSYRRKITFNNADQAENLVNFPVVVKANNSSLAWSTLIQADMDDVIFVDADDTTPLSFEWETKAPAGDSIAWVKVPQINLSSSADYIYMYYGNGTTSDYSHQRGVWDSNTVANYHMNQPSGHLSDSKGSYNSTAETNLTYSATGKIGNAIEFNGTDSNANIGDVTQLNSASAFTTSFWMNQDVLDQNDNILLKQLDGSNLIQISPRATGSFGFFIYNGSSAFGYWDYSTTISAGSWFHISMVYDGTQVDNATRLKVYVNGSAIALSYSGTIPTTTPNLAGYPATIGRSSEAFDGKLDEFKISSNARSAPWIAAEYKNQTDTFNYIGAAEGKNYPITADGAWYAGAGGTWSYRQKITVDHTKVASDLTDFPMLVKITDGANAVFDNAQSDADDILFTTSNGTTKLSHEIEKFTTSSGTRELDAWVKTNLSTSTDTVLYMYYGNAGVASQQDQANVWEANYKGVWHLNEASGTVYDATSNNNDGATSGTVSFGQTGKVNSAMSLAASGSGYVNFASFGNFQPPITISAWINPSTTNGEVIFGTSPYSIYFRKEATTNRLYSQYRNGSGTWKNIFGNGSKPISVNSWSRVSLTYTSGVGGKLYLNGEDITASSDVDSSLYTSTTAQIGRHDGGSYFTGLVDEVTSATTVRTPEWIATEYANQNSPSTFFSLASEAKTASYASPTGTGGGSGIINTLWNGGWGSPNGFSSNVTIPANTSISYQIRSSAVGGPNDGDWTAWGSLGTAIATGTYNVPNGSMPAITLGANKYLQVRSFLTTTDGQSTPVLADYTIYYLEDVDPPTNPTTTGLTIGGVAQTTGTWTNDIGAVSTSFSGATDTESGVAGYYLYLGTDSGADPSTYQAHVGAGGDTQTWATGTTLSSADDGKTYYLRAKTKDNSNNTPAAATLFTFSLDTTPPTRPDYITANPAGYTTTNSFDFTWPAGTDPVGGGGGASGIAYYQYKRSTDGSWTDTAGPDDRAANDITAYQEGANTFYVRTVDTADNISTTYTQVTYYWSGEAPPKPVNLDVAPLSSDTNSFTISWDKPSQDPGESPIIGYYFSFNEPPTALNTTYIASTDAHVSIGPDSYATQQGENTVYVTSRNEAGIGSFLPEYYASDTFTCNTAAPPIPTSVSIYDSSDKVLQRFSISLNWLAGVGQDPSSFDHYLIERSTNGTDYSTLATTANASFINTDLSDAITYYYRVKAVDNAGSTSAASTIVSLKPSGKYTSPPPLLTAPTVITRPHEAEISWLTERTSTSFIRYSTDENDLSELKGQEEWVISHKVTLTGLKANAKYYYKTQSFDLYRDYALESAYSTTHTFITPDAPSISKVEVANITLTSADIKWETTTIATSTLHYGKTSSYGKDIEDISGISSTQHSTKLSALEHSTNYHFEITATDIDGNELSSDDYSFETLPIPKIISFKLTRLEDRATQSAKVTFETNVETSTVVKYQAAGAVEQEIVKSKLEKTHDVEIADLLDNAKYTIYAQGKDQFGNVATSDKLNYETPFDTRPPKVEKIEYEVSTVGLLSGKAQIIVSFTTDEPAQAYVEYGEGLGGGYTRQTSKEDILKTSHVKIISELDPMQTYHFRVNALDKSGNTSTSSEYVFATGQATESILNIILRALRSVFGWMM